MIVNSCRVSLFLRWIIIASVLITTSDKWSRINLFVEGSSWWSLNNQVPKEERPYTIPANVIAGKGPQDMYVGGENVLLQPKLREMHQYCDGQCFYAPQTCDLEKYQCAMTASVAMHDMDPKGDLYCDIFGSDPLRDAFCSLSETTKAYKNETGKEDIFYTITLHRMLGNPGHYSIPNNMAPLPSCRKKWYDETGRRCRRTEFVAISFVKEGSPTEPVLHEDDLWYVCVADEPQRSRVKMWTKVTNDSTIQAQQILDTKPHHDSGVGVIFSKVMIDDELASMGCQFVIQESNMTLKHKPNNTIPRNAVFFDLKNTSTITVKLGVGYVERDHDNNDVVKRPFHLKYEYFVYHGSDIKPTDKLDLVQLNKTNIVRKDSKADVDLDKKSMQKINDVLKKCNDRTQYKDLYIACYPPNFQLNCVHTGHCPVMFIVEHPRSHKSFKKIKAHLYSFLPDAKSLRKSNRRPIGYVAVGFSKDNQMGRDVVIICHADGMNSSDGGVTVRVSINFDKANIYPSPVNFSYDHLVTNTEGYGTAEHNRILCSWEMKTDFVVNMFSYAPDYKDVIPTGMSEKLEFDFKKRAVYLLVSAGNRNYQNGTIVHHDFRQVLKEKFSKDLFFKKAKACGIVGNGQLVLVLLVLIYLFV